MGRNDRPGAPHRRKLNEARRRRALDRRGALVALAALTAAAVAVLGLLCTIARTPQFMTGALCGVVVTSIVALVFWWVDHGAGAQNAKFGLYGEESTAELFASKRARRANWEVRNNLEFKVDRRIVDVDHVVFGPLGVLAIESKWVNPTPDPNRHRENAFGMDAIAQAKRSRRRIEHLLRASGVEVEVVAVVLQWGPGAWGDLDATMGPIDGVLVLRGDVGDALLDEFEAISAERLSDDELERVRAVLDARVERRPSPRAARTPATSL
jgi:hypothetical protein